MAAIEADSELGERLQNLQPAIREYIESNVESEVARKQLALLTLAMDWVS